MSDKLQFRTFSTAFKIAAVERVEAGEAVLPMARELGVPRKELRCVTVELRCRSYGDSPLRSYGDSPLNI